MSISQNNKVLACRGIKLPSVKVPSHEDYYNYDGAHCHQLWRELSDTWQCPSCKRTKFQIMRWTTRYKKNQDGGRVSYKGWMAGLHKHHDHSQNILSSKEGRFSTVVVCDQCNTSDGAAKRKLLLPENFSFSPLEIGEFITSKPHTKHSLNFEVAKKLYTKASG